MKARSCNHSIIPAACTMRFMRAMHAATGGNPGILSMRSMRSMRGGFISLSCYAFYGMRVSVTAYLLQGPQITENKSQRIKRIERICVFFSAIGGPMHFMRSVRGGFNFRSQGPPESCLDIHRHRHRHRHTHIYTHTHTHTHICTMICVRFDADDSQLTR
jgi:hypothetical protein